ncbi:MAG: amidohydrolase family protein [Rhodothermales bacterium]|nr:amidohydrolase family protein [Rhodothermales bacterium]
MPRRLLLTNARFVAPGQPPRSAARLLVDPGLPLRFDPPEGDVAGVPTVDVGGAMVSVGWTDLYARTGEPGHEPRETLASAAAAAVAGGFSTLALAPETDPVLDTAAAVRFVQERAAALPVAMPVVGALTKGRNGRELAELGDLADAGCAAFSDGQFVADAGLMRRALEYAAMLDRPVFVFPHDPALAVKGLVHEGAAGTRAGALGIPEIAETAAIARDLLLADYTGARLHVLHATTRRSLDLVREAKARGVAVTASVSATHLVLTDEDVEASGYDPATKVRPPLRPKADRAALREALLDGTLDAVFSDHAPYALHETDLEYAAAPFGASALETTWAVLATHLVGPGLLPVERAVELLAGGPRRALGLPPTDALTVFDADTTWAFNPAAMRSKSRHTPFAGAALTGRVRGLVVGGRWLPASS